MVDVIGRVWTPRVQREAALDEFERSGMAGTKFAKRIGHVEDEISGVSKMQLTIIVW